MRAVTQRRFLPAYPRAAACRPDRHSVGRLTCPRGGDSLNSRMSGRPLRSRVVLVVALAALLGHVCALETETAHGSAEHARSTDAVPGHSGEAPPDVHAASCDGIKPTSMGPLVSTVHSQPMATVRLGRIWSRQSPGAASLTISRPALFILHASLLI